MLHLYLVIGPLSRIDSTTHVADPISRPLLQSLQILRNEIKVLLLSHSLDIVVFFVRYGAC